MSKDPELQAHLEWLGYVQPTGIVVSPHALVRAQAHVNRNIVPEQRRFLEWVKEIPQEGSEPRKAVTDLRGLFQHVFGWEPSDLVDSVAMAELADAPEVVLPAFSETLRPTYAVPNASPAPETNRWLMLIQNLPLGTDLDTVIQDSGHSWQATPEARFERLLRESGVSIGLVSNDTDLRLVYAPSGETSGYITFPVKAMTEVAGRPIFAALHLLLSADRLFFLPEKQRLPAILAESRKYQNVVSTQLAEQVLSALYELLRGFQAADERRKGLLLHEVLREDPNHVYHGLLTVLLRLVFVLFAEDRGLFPSDSVYVKNYSLAGLFERLREDFGRYTDTMDQRYGAWAQLLALFRLIHDGGGHGSFRLIPRHGRLFSPDIYNFLEGRTWTLGRVMGERIDPPFVSDGVVFRVLEKLMVLDGERLSYRGLDVQEVGSVYQTMMGFILDTAKGPSIAIRPTKPHGAPTTINLEQLLEVSPERRSLSFREETGQEVSGEALEAIKLASSPEALAAAMDRKVSREATPGIVPLGAMILQPSDERRRSGSHYTPRSLTEPVVRTTLKQILEGLGKKLEPEQILDLKICDPAMGSGAFLVEVCRQLADALVESWHVHKRVPSIPPDEDEVLHARRLVAQRCLYGLDKNPVAVDLAKLSLWLATLARDHPFTFLDHALRHGDTLVGLDRQQIASFHWLPSAQLDWLLESVGERVAEASTLREQIRAAVENAPEEPLNLLLKDADEALEDVRLMGDLVISAFFSSDSKRGRERLRAQLQEQLRKALEAKTGLSEFRPIASVIGEGPRPVFPFHWEIEFPEVFDRENGGFDAFVGNPPFMWGNRISRILGDSYRDWLLSLHDGANGNGDLVAHFLRRCFGMARLRGHLGLVTTNSISESDTRVTGLNYVVHHDGTIYAAVRDQSWPGASSVRVAHVFVTRGPWAGKCRLDGKEVAKIGSDLRESKSDWTAVALQEREGQSFKGVDFGGTGFLISPNLRDSIVAASPQEDQFIWPVLNASEFMTAPDLRPGGYIVNFTGLSLAAADKAQECMKRVRKLVLPKRLRDKRKARKDRWWLYNEACIGMYAAISGMQRVLVGPVVSKYAAFGFLSPRVVFTNALNVFVFDSWAAFTLLQSRVHELWALRQGSSLESRPRYNPTDCFETFPFPQNWATIPVLEAVGKAYYEVRAALMVKKEEGLTNTYNRFHDPVERDPEIATLRELHAAMDRAVLDAYGWSKIRPECEFLLDLQDTGEAEADSERRRREPWRLRWPDEIRDDVFARLLVLNRERAEAERIDSTALTAGKSRNQPRSVAGSAVNTSGSLFGVEGE